jgi:hypothetical protein
VCVIKICIGSKDDGRNSYAFSPKLPQQIKPAEKWHPDVRDQKINRMSGKDIERYSTVPDRNDLEMWSPGFDN